MQTNERYSRQNIQTFSVVSQTLDMLDGANASSNVKYYFSNKIRGFDTSKRRQ